MHPIGDLIAMLLFFFLAYCPTAKQLRIAEEGYEAEIIEQEEIAYEKTILRHEMEEFLEEEYHL